MTSNVSNLGPSTGPQMGWSVTDSIKNRLGLNSASKNPNIELAKDVAKRAIDFSSDFFVPEILGGYFSPLAYLGIPTKAALGIVYNATNAVAHTALAAKKALDGDATERNNHIKSAAKFGSRIVADSVLFAIGTPAILAVSLANLIAPKQLREGTEKAFKYIDGKIGTVYRPGVSHSEIQTDDVVMKVSTAFLRKTRGLLTLGADGKLREPGSEAEALAGGRRTRRKV
ncbi:MAG: hypothetical protein K940chlam5_00836 [Candidatus Anoxychlamydiales bacterium]|nr:hypothetical protein [Candidatus Anoxychlamydiales bacterium]